MIERKMLMLHADLPWVFADSVIYKPIYLNVLAYMCIKLHRKM